MCGRESRASRAVANQLGPAAADLLVQGLPDDHDLASGHRILRQGQGDGHAGLFDDAMQVDFADPFERVDEVDQRVLPQRPGRLESVGRRT